MLASLSLAAVNQAAVEYAITTAGRALQSARDFLTHAIKVGSDHWGVIAVAVVVLAIFAVFKNISSPDAR